MRAYLCHLTLGRDVDRNERNKAMAHFVALRNGTVERTTIAFPDAGKVSALPSQENTGQEPPLPQHAKPAGLGTQTTLPSNLAVDTSLLDGASDGAAAPTDFRSMHAAKGFGARGVGGKAPAVGRTGKSKKELLKEKKAAASTSAKRARVERDSSDDDDSSGDDSSDDEAPPPAQQSRPQSRPPRSLCRPSTSTSSR